MPHRHHTSKEQVDYRIRTATGIAYSTYLVRGRTCKLAHLDARWQNHSLPLALNLRGGNLRSVALEKTKTGVQITVFDRWGRKFTTTLAKFSPDGLMLWGDEYPLRAAVGGRWQTEGGLEVVVGRDGPRLYYLEEGHSTLPREWDVDTQRFVEPPSVYQP